MSEGEGLAIKDGSGVNAAKLEFADECLVVVGSHGRPASILRLSVENVN